MLRERPPFYFQQDVKTAKTAVSRITITPETCLRLMKEMQSGSGTFRETGGVHNAALCDTEKLLFMRTDIGRHNALDKLYGCCLKNGMPVRDKLIVFSGRISSEVLLKPQNRGVDCHFKIGPDGARAANGGRAEHNRDRFCQKRII